MTLTQQEQSPFYVIKSKEKPSSHIACTSLTIHKIFKQFENGTSIQNSPVSGSLATVAVNPAAEEDFPDV